MKNKKIIRSSKFIVLTSIIIFILYALYAFVDKAASTVPLMDYWDYITWYVEPIFEGTFSFFDFWREEDILRISPLVRFILLVDIWFFAVDIRVQVMFGFFVLSIYAVVVSYKFYFKSVQIGYMKHIILFTLTIAISIVNFNQWEVITQAFSPSFFLRMLTYIVIIYLTGDLLSVADDKAQYKKTIIVGVIMLINIVFIATPYYYALVLSLVVGVVIKTIDSKNKNALAYGGIIIVFSGIGTFLNYGLSHTTSGLVSDTLNTSFQGLFSLDTLYACVLMVGALFTHALSNNMINTIIGLFVVVFSIYITFLFIRKKLYRVSYFPLIIFLYGVISIGVIVFTRVPEFGAEYAVSSRYVVDTTFSLIGLLVMLFMIVQDSKLGLRIMAVSFCGFTVCALICCAVSEYKIAPNRAEYSNNLAIMMNDIDNYSDEELAVFQASTAQIARGGVEILKKYNLSVFNSESRYYTEKINEQSTGNSEIYEDGWVEPNSVIYVQTGKTGEIILSCYYPYEITENQVVSIFLEGDLIEEYEIVADAFDIKVRNLPKNESVELEIKSNFSQRGEAPDIRELSFMIYDVIVN